MFLRDLLHTKELYNKAWRESGDFIEYTPEELRQKQLEVLKIFKDIQAVCEKHNFHLALCGGTALGAVRHKGFIPWDDDMDVNIPRADFEEFKKIFEDELGDKYILNCPNYSKDPIARFAKILRKGDFFDGKTCPEIFLDIFILDNVPDSLFLQKVKGFFCNAIMFIAGCVGQRYEGTSAYPALLRKHPVYKMKNLIGFVFSFMSRTTWYNIVDKIIRTKKNTGYCAITTGRKHYNGELFAKTDVFPLKKVPFEDTEGYIFNDIHTYLVQMYSTNYMTLPPEEKRERHYKKAL